MYALIRKLLFALPAELAHEIGLVGLDWGGVLLAERPPEVPVELLGLTFPNPVGLAAGLDKNGDHIDALAALGFGFIEIGTVTPLPQPGNPKPRMFRLPQHQAIINRMGFNNKGVDYLVSRVRRRRSDIILGINIGKNKDTPNERALDDYLQCLEKVYELADYITINISSPNTEGLRDLQHKAELEKLLSGIKQRQTELADTCGSYTPMLVKLAPDLDVDSVEGIADTLNGLQIDGVIATNTTLARDGISGAHAEEIGGLSGAPLKTRADKVLSLLSRHLNSNIPLVGVGGITKGGDATDKIDAGARLIQLYTGFIYQGPKLITECCREIRSHS